MTTGVEKLACCHPKRFRRKLTVASRGACRAPKVADVSPCVGPHSCKSEFRLMVAADVRLERNSQFSGPLAPLSIEAGTVVLARSFVELLRSRWACQGNSRPNSAARQFQQLQIRVNRTILLFWFSKRSPNNCLRAFRDLRLDRGLGGLGKLTRFGGRVAESCG